MFDEVAPPRDVSQLRLPLIGRVDRDVSGAWQVFGPDGQPSSAVRRFLSDLSASDCAVSTIRSYAYDLLRWREQWVPVSRGGKVPDGTARRQPVLPGSGPGANGQCGC